MSSRFVPRLVGTAALALLPAGCGGPPQFQAEGRELLRGLQTAVSAQEPEWLDATEKKTLAQHRAGKVSDAEFHAMNDVLRKARAGRWGAAQTAVAALIDAQRPTAEDMENLERTTPRSER